MCIHHFSTEEFLQFQTNYNTTSCCLVFVYIFLKLIKENFFVVFLIIHDNGNNKPVKWLMDLQKINQQLSSYSIKDAEHDFLNFFYMHVNCNFTLALTQK